MIRLRLTFAASLAAAVACACAAPSAADEVYTFVIKKQEAKKSTRWSLQEWLETRDRMRLMDLWLALHTPTPYEFYLGTDYQLTGQATDAKGNSVRLAAAAYATLFGLGIEKSLSSYEDFTALGLVRIFGYHAQGTNLTLHGGVRAQTGPVSARNSVAGASLSIYLTRHVGIEGMYRRFFAGTPGATGVRTRGHRWEAGAFIDFSFVRLLGKAFWDAETWLAPGGNTDVERSGAALGTRIFF